VGSSSYTWSKKEQLSLTGSALVYAPISCIQTTKMGYLTYCWSRALQLLLLLQLLLDHQLPALPPLVNRQQTQ